MAQSTESKRKKTAPNCGEAPSVEEELEEIDLTTHSAAKGDNSATGSSAALAGGYNSASRGANSPAGSSNSAAPDPNSSFPHAKDGKSSIRASNLDAGPRSILEDDVMEKIVARLPSPFLFQASTLSKAWRLRFRSPSFQHEVQSCSHASWKLSSPMFFNMNTDRLVSYDCSSRAWSPLPPLSYLPFPWGVDSEILGAAGSLLFCTSGSPITMFVTNPFTRSWQQLPDCPNKRIPLKGQVLQIIGNEERKGYKIIVSRYANHQKWLQIFDSADGSWTKEVLRSCRGSKEGGHVVINGVLHILVYKCIVPYVSSCVTYWHISFDLKEKIWKTMSCLYRGSDDNSKEGLMFFGNTLSEIFVCGSKVLLVVGHMEPSNSSAFQFFRPALSVFDLNLDDGSASELSSAPAEVLDHLVFNSYGRPANDKFTLGGATCDGNWICFGQSWPSIFYNVGTREWLRKNLAAGIPRSMGDAMEWLWAPTTYQPGLNPFLEI